MESSFPASDDIRGDLLRRFQTLSLCPNLLLMFCLTSYRNHSSAADLSQQFSDPGADNSVPLLFPEHPQTLHTLLQATTCSSFLPGGVTHPCPVNNFPVDPLSLFRNRSIFWENCKRADLSLLMLNSSTWRAVHLGANPR